MVSTKPSDTDNNSKKLSSSAVNFGVGAKNCISSDKDIKINGNNCQISIPEDELNITKKHSVDFIFSANPKTLPNLNEKRNWTNLKKKAEKKQEIWTINLQADKHSQSFNSASYLSEEKSLESREDHGSDSSDESFTGPRNRGPKKRSQALKDSFMEM